MMVRWVLVMGVGAKAVTLPMKASRAVVASLMVAERERKRKVGSERRYQGGGRFILGANKYLTC